MGAGKSSLGKRLASRLNVSFIDADKAIEKNVGMSIPEIFEEQGEATFRQLEKKWLEDLSEGNDVIALGGGTPCFDKNMQLIKSKGLAIYLDVPIPILASRLKNAQEKRPLIEAVKDDQNALTQLIENMLSEREVYYKQAQLTFKANDVKAQDLDDLIERINAY